LLAVLTSARRHLVADARYQAASFVKDTDIAALRLQGVARRPHGKIGSRPEDEPEAEAALAIRHRGAALDDFGGPRICFVRVTYGPQWPLSDLCGSMVTYGT
jgi:hypothetical protein